MPGFDSPIDQPPPLQRALAVCLLTVVSLLMGMALAYVVVPVEPGIATSIALFGR